nr:hypothetical protein [Tanacetum cinerariifolium]
MTGNISYLSEYKPYDGGYVSFGQGGGKITGKGIIKTGKLEFENVYFVKDLKYNLFSVSQIRDNKNSVLFIDSECIMLRRDFKLKDDTNVLLRTPRQHNMYSIDLNNIVPHKDLTCLVAKAFADESMLWHRRLGHLNFKTMDKLVRHNLVKGLPSKCFENDHTCVAFLKGQQHKASCKTKLVNYVSKPLHTLHMDLFGPTFDETSGILRNFITEIENLKDLKVKIIRCDDGGTSSTNFSGTKDVASQDVKKDVSSLRYIALSNWFHEAHLESSTMESAILTVSSSVPTACLDDSPETSSAIRLISKRVTSQDETPSLDNILTLSNRFEDILGVSTNTVDTNGVEADLSNMESIIPASPTPTLRIYKDHPKSQIIGLVDTPVQTKHKSKEMEEQSFIAIIHQKTNLDLLQFCLFSCFLSQEEPKKIYDALKDPSWFPDRVYKVEKAMLGLHQALRAWYGTLSKYLLAHGFQRGTIDQTLFIRKYRGDFLLVQVYVDDIIFGSSNPQLCREFEALMHDKFQMSAMDVRSANTPMDKENPWGKDGPSKDVDLHLYRSMIESLMYLTASRPDIMFAACACARHQVTPKECHLHAVKRIFRYLKGHPKLGLWYPKESLFDLVASLDSNYGGATHDRKSTTEGLISWQCKKQTIVATFTTEAEYVAAASGCGQVLWIQNQLLDYGLAFCDYHNMIAILEKSDHNINFHQIVDFVEASHIMYALTINPTVYVSHIRQFWSTAKIETTNEGTKILATVDGKPRTISESLIRRNLKLNDEEGISSLSDAELFKNFALMGYNILPNQNFTFRKGRTVPLFATMLVTQGEGSGTPTEPNHTPSPEAQQSPHHDLSSSLHPTVTTETIPTDTPTKIPTLRQYSRRATQITQSKTLPTAAYEPVSLVRDDSQGEAFPTVSGLEAGQDKLMDLCTHLQRQQTEVATKIAAQDLEISSLKARIKLLEDKDKGTAELSGDDAPIKGRSLETGEETGVERSTERGTVSVPPAAKVSTIGVPTGSGLVPTVSAIFTTASVVTPYSRRPREISAKDKEMEEQMARKDQRMDEQIARDAEIARIHAEEELQMLIDGLDRNNEVIAKHLQEYEQSEAELTIREKIDLINELVKYQDHHAKILKYQAQQSKPLSKKEQREFYMSVLRSHSGWKTKHFRGMTLKEIREKFVLVWKQIEDFVPMTSKEEG